MKTITFSKAIALLALFLALAACEKTELTSDISPALSQTSFADSLHNQLITIPVGAQRSVNAYLTKPQGDSLDLVLVLHGGTRDYAKSVEATLGQVDKEDGGKQFLDAGYAILALQYTEFAGPSDTMGVTKGIMEMQDVISTVDYVQSGELGLNGFDVQKFYAFGHSRGGANALLAGVGRELDAVISAEGPLNWIQINDSIESGFLTPTDRERVHYDSTTAEWGDPDVDPTLWIRYSASERLPEFKSPFMVIQGEQDPAAFVELATEMERRYDLCGSCNEEASFIIHPAGHVDWAYPAILDSIQGFLQAH